MLDARSTRRLNAELGAWSDAGTRARIWWRDDDVTAATPALARLRALSEAHGVGVALACIPSDFDESLVDGLWPGTVLWQHGYAHVNHAPSGAKKVELGSHRPLVEVLDELTLGKQRLVECFGSRFEPVLVPPWNRIDSGVASALPQIGLRQLSTFGARSAQTFAPSVQRVNTHIDIIDWRGTRGFVGERTAIDTLLRCLREQREGCADADEPIGLLTHHLVHDDECWHFLDDLLRFSTSHDAVRTVAPREVFANG